MSRAEIAARQNFPGGLKFVRWNHTATPGSNELTVRIGDEVDIIKRLRENDESGWFEVKNRVTEEIGYIPKRCFYIRMKVQFSYVSQKEGELSVNKDETIGVIDEDIKDETWLVMKEDGTTGRIPFSCCYTLHEVHEDHKAANSKELSVNKGDNIGIIDKGIGDGYWEGYFRGRTGLIPSKCFEPFPEGNSLNIVDQEKFRGGLKFVRWDHTATPGSKELTVTKGDEVIIITSPKEDDETGWYKVKHTVTGEIGNIPKSCFYRRMKVNFRFTGQETGELSVDEDEVIGVINEDTEDDMWLVMKENKTIGKIPVRCFYTSYKAYGNHIAAKSGELSVNKGDNIGIMDKNRDDGYWKGYFRGRTGLVPSKCFEPPVKVYWDYEAEKKGDLTVKEGNTVTIVDHEATSTHGKIRVRLDDKIGYIPQRCFETPIQVYKDHERRQKNEISVAKGEMVGMVKGVDSPEGYFMVRLGDTAGLVPTECFEIPARVIVDYESTNPNELSVKKGDEVSVMNAIANVQVRLGHKIGHIPLKCINIEVTEVAGMLEKKEHEEKEARVAAKKRRLQSKKRRLQSEKSISKTEKERDVDNSALNYPLEYHLSLNLLNIKTFLKDETFPADKAEELGVYLGIKPGRISALKNNNNDADRLLSEIITEWLNNDDEKSWDKLATALRYCNHSVMADKLLKFVWRRKREATNDQHDLSSKTKRTKSEDTGVKPMQS